MANGKMKKILLITAVVLFVVGIGAGGYVLGSWGKGVAKTKSASEEIAGDAGADVPDEKKPEGETAKNGEKPGPPSKKDLTFTFQDFTVNLLDPKARTFLRASIQIEAKSSQAFKVIEDNVAPLRDVTVSLLTGKTRDEVATPESWDRIKRELMERYEGKLGAKVIGEVYVTDHNIIMN